VNIRLFDLLIFSQPLIWIYILKFKHKIPDGFSSLIDYMPLLSIPLFLYIYHFKVHFQFYSMSLLIIYIIFVNVSYTILSFKFNKVEALCLAFLIVYMNSLYWELNLHFVALIQGEISNTIKQIVSHVYFIPFLMPMLKIRERNKAIKTLLYGLVFTASMNIYRGFYFFLRTYFRRNDYPFSLSGSFFYVNIMIRVVCLMFLLKTFISHIEIKDHG